MKKQNKNIEQTQQTKEPLNIEVSDAETKAEINCSDNGNSDKKKTKLKNTLKELTTKLELEKDKRLRALADFDNFRKRTQSEFGQIIKGANERLIKQMLPVLDDFERLLNQDSTDDNNTYLLQGAELIHKKLHAILSVEGLQPIEAVDKPFDANLHEAMAQMNDPSKPNGTVLTELEKGYRLGDRIIRFSKVFVSKVPEVADRTVEEHKELEAKETNE
ncbi:MAG: nucleotide exchange factor GrpE [Candidatus Hatepunaea meridiana]|nr:nucleotide exchange factor GrpE [Candidatus Hatepunaea meridiana]